MGCLTTFRPFDFYALAQKLDRARGHRRFFAAREFFAPCWRSVQK
jgi:hypothetical protein